MRNTRISLSPEARRAVADLLNQTLANLSDLASQTRHAHWNVRGPAFISLHKLFDELSDTVAEHLDPVAERVTTLGGQAFGTLRQAATRTSLPDLPFDESGALPYVALLADRFGVVANQVRAAIDAAAAAGDADSADLLTGISRDLDKALWFLEAHDV